jgi:hypothetical protein
MNRAWAAAPPAPILKLQQQRVEMDPETAAAWNAWLDQRVDAKLHNFLDGIIQGMAETDKPRLAEF